MNNKITYLEVDSEFEDFDALKIQIASPEEIRSWSRGEVTNPETINYRTGKPERDGLFCERIFGPVRDYECSCGKYKKIRYKGIVCDRCGVEVTTSAVRRERMGHIELAIPVAHPLFYKVPPSKIGLLLDLSITHIESILNYDAYIVLEQGNSPYKRLTLIYDEEEYKEACEKYTGFKAETGAGVLKKLLEELDLDDLSAELKSRIKHEVSKRRALLNRLKVVEAFRQSGMRPEWMILEVIPVIPPDLRPLITLEGGRYATSDINDLYKRVIIRNNRLKHLMAIRTPEIILKNEKRMLQEAVNALFDNEHLVRPVRGRGNRPLKSLMEILRGKQGRFRRNLLGKRVDYSGRSVIVVDPHLKLHECSLPKEMTKELFKPMILHKLEEEKLTTLERSAKELYRLETEEMWEVLEEVIKNHPVMLNRAPTLHRVSIEAFYPKLWEHKAIGIHPLVCPPFNADFDGDTMSVHVPLTPEAILETAVLILSSNNFLSPAHGKPLMVPTQDMVLGIHYLTKEHPKEKKVSFISDSYEEVETAYETGSLSLFSKITFVHNGERIETTVGRVIFNSILPEKLRFINITMNKKEITELIHKCFKAYGFRRTAEFLDDLKDIGFKFATKCGVSIGIDDIIIPKKKKETIDKALREVKKYYNAFRKGLITEREKYNNIINTWANASAKLTEELVEELKKDQDGFNPIYMLVISGARGSIDQAKQISAMRGLMSRPSRRVTGEEIIERPIISSFKEGLTVLEYFISTHGARKGLTDTALKTAEAGYLTRRLVDVSQDVIVTMEDCGTIMGEEVGPLRIGGKVIEPLSERTVGRIALETVVNPLTNEAIVHAGEEIDEEKAKEIENAGIDKVKVRSVLTCEAPHGVCAKCYGWNLATGRLVELGEAVGIVAAQSIGEPGTQLTLRTFHYGGVAQRAAEQTRQEARFDGTVKFINVIYGTRSDGENVVLEEGGIIELKNRKLSTKFNVPRGAILRCMNGRKVKKGDVLFEWEPYVHNIITKHKGKVKYVDIVHGITLREDITEMTEAKQMVITEDREKKRHPRIEVIGDNGDVFGTYELPKGAFLLVEDGESVNPGDTLAKYQKEITKTADITGGLPRVAELFEAKHPKNPAIISEIDGVVEIEPPKEGIRIVRVISDSGTVKEYKIPYAKLLLVEPGQRVKAGDKLCEGNVDPHDILRVKGRMAVMEFLTNEIQEVYRMQGVKINDKHIALIVRQMLSKVRIDNPGDSNFVEGEIVERTTIQEVNEKLRKEGLKPATFHPILLGITRSALATESWLSAASFQETARVLSMATIEGRVDRLRGIKENVIVGKLIPAGTGFADFVKLKEELIKEKEVKTEAI